MRLSIAERRVNHYMQRSIEVPGHCRARAFSKDHQ